MQGKQIHGTIARSDDGDTLEYDVADEAELEQMIIGMQIIDFTED